MKNPNLWLFLFIIFSSYNAICKNDPDIISYNIVIKLDTVSRNLEVQTDILIDNPDTSSVLKFLFWESIKINKAQINDKKLDYRYANDTLYLNIGSRKKNVLTLHYSIPIDSLIIFKQYKIIALNRSGWWCPFMKDDLSELHSKITVPKGYKVYSSGELVSYDETSSGNCFRYYNKINSGLPLFIAPEGYYKEVDKKQDHILIKYLFHNPDTVLTNSIIKESLSTIHFCADYIGNYNRPQLTYIEFPGFPSAQGLETFVLMGSDFIKYFGLYPQMRFWVAHETIHQWIGAGYFNAVYKSPQNGRFIEESFTEFVRDIYLEKTFGEDSLAGQIRDRINIYNKEIKGKDQDVPVSVNMPNRVTYVIGSLIFHVVRMEMGEDNWHNFIRSLYAKNYGRMIDYNDFRNELSLFANQSVINKMENNIIMKGIPTEITNSNQFIIH
jgi:hypothetical protein